MRKLTLITLAAGVAMVASACEGPETYQPMDLEPSFGVEDLSCAALNNTVEVVEYVNGDRTVVTWTKTDLLDHIYNDLIPEFFETRASINSAQTHIETTARKLCDEDYGAAAKMGWSFFLQVDQQLDGGSREPPYTYEAGDLMTNTFGLVWNPESGQDPLEVPPGTFEITGGIGVLTTKKGGLIFTRNLKAAVEVKAGDFPAGDDVYIVLSRDDGIKIPGYAKSFLGGYWVAVSQELQETSDGVLVQVCIDEDVRSNYQDFIRLGHKGDESNILDPPVWEDLSIDCSKAGTYAAASLGAPLGWLSSATRWAGTGLRNLLTPTLLFAEGDGELVGGVGLGGRTKSFSPFAPVDIYSSLSLSIAPEESTIAVDETVQLEATLSNPFNLDLSELVPPPVLTWSSEPPSGVVTVDANGEVTGDKGGEATIKATFGPLPNGETLSATATVTVLPLVELVVNVVNDADNAKEFRVFWDQSWEGSPLECQAEPRTTNTCSALFPASRPVTLKAEALWPTLPNKTVPGFDVRIEPTDLGAGCASHQVGSGFATCEFDMRSESFTITFTQLNGGGG